MFFFYFICMLAFKSFNSKTQSFNGKLYEIIHCNPCTNFIYLKDWYIIKWICYTEKHTVFHFNCREFFRCNFLQQFWLIYTQWHIMKIICRKNIGLPKIQILQYSSLSISRNTPLTTIEIMCFNIGKR